MFINKLKSFLGLTFAFEAKRYANGLAVQAKKDMGKKLTELNSEYEKIQKKMEANFDYWCVENISVNFFDDFDTEEDGSQSTTAVVRGCRAPNTEGLKVIPDSQCLEILFELMAHIKKEEFLPPSVAMRIELDNPIDTFPTLVANQPCYLYKQWKIKFENITTPILDDLIKCLAGAVTIKDRAVVFTREP